MLEVVASVDLSEVIGKRWRMEARQKSLLLPIGAVVAQLRRRYPDVTHSSLRFLEREGFVDPIRTPGGHRLYSPADIDRIHQIKTWQSERLSLDEVRRRLAAQSALGTLDALARRFLDAALDGSPEASRLILNADDLGVPLVRLFQDVLRPALIEVGEQWANGALRVGQEHEVTEIVRELVAELALRHAHPRPTGPAILAAGVAGERHDLGLRMIVALLRARGRPVHFLGADVDAPFLQEEVAMRRPAVVLITATLIDRLPAIKAAAEALRESASPQPFSMVLGGQVVRQYRDELHEWGVVPASDDDLAVALETILSVPETAESPR
jgi:MerR family transcriptional regulator, light-induced transcriptional regulator